MRLFCTITVLLAAICFPATLSQRQALFVKKEIVEAEGEGGKRVARQTSADQMVQNILQWLQGVYTQNSRRIRQGTLREYLPPSNTQKPRPFQPVTQGNFPSNNIGDNNIFNGGYPPAGITPQPPFSDGIIYPSINPSVQIPSFNGYPTSPQPSFTASTGGYPGTNPTGPTGPTGFPSRLNPDSNGPNEYPSSTGPTGTSTSSFPQPTNGYPNGPSTAYPAASTTTTSSPSSTTGFPSATTGFPNPSTSYPSSTTGFPSTTTGYPSPTTGYPSPTTGYPSPTTGYPSPTTGYPSPTTGYPSPTTGYPSPTTGYPSPTTGYPTPSTSNPSSSTGYPITTSTVYPSSNTGYPTSSPRPFPSRLGTSSPTEASTYSPTTEDADNVPPFTSYPQTTLPPLTTSDDDDNNIIPSEESFTTVPDENKPDQSEQTTEIFPRYDDDLRHPPHIHAIDVECSKEMMTIKIEFNRPFDGIIYSKGHYNSPECRYVQENSGRTKYTFTVNLNSCGTEFVNAFDTQGKSYLENVLVLQNEPGIQEVWDTIRSVRCLWEGNLKKALNVAFSVGMLNQEIVTFSGDTAMARLDIQLGKGPFAPPANGLVKIGEVMTLVVSVTGDPGFDIQVKDCKAKDSNGGNSVALTDDRGCILKPKLFGAFQKTRNTGSTGASIIAYAFFNAFKFPDVMDLVLECNVDLCKTDCEMCPEPDQKTDPGRRRRRDLYSENTTNDNSVTMGKLLRVILPEDLNEGNATIAITQSEGICMSTQGFVLSSAVLISLLTSSCLFSAYMWFKYQRLSFKK